MKTYPRFRPREDEAHELVYHLIEVHGEYPSVARHAWKNDHHNHLHQRDDARGEPDHVHKDGFHDVNGRPVSVGDHICVVSMPEDPDPLPAGATGVVTEIVEDTYHAKLGQLWVTWDAPHERRTLNIVESDQFVILVD